MEYRDVVSDSADQLVPCLQGVWLTVPQLLPCYALQHNDGLFDCFYAMLQYLHYVPIQAVQFLCCCTAMQHQQVLDCLSLLLGYLHYL